MATNESVSVLSGELVKQFMSERNKHLNGWGIYRNEKPEILVIRCELLHEDVLHTAQHSIPFELIERMLMSAGDYARRIVNDLVIDLAESAEPGIMTDESVADVLSTLARQESL